MSKFTKDSLDKVFQACTVFDVTNHYLELQRKGSGYSADCPFCGAVKKFSVAKAKDIWKCWSCNEGGKALEFVQKYKNLDYDGAMEALSHIVKIPLDAKPEKKEFKPGPQKPKAQAPKSQSFRDKQLAASGLSLKETKTFIPDVKGTQIEIERYEAATINDRFDVVPGDDMVMHYLTLNGGRMTYTAAKTNLAKPMIRVRWQIPENHPFADGSFGKYKSPYGSGSPLWFPNQLIAMYQNKIQFDTLYVQEGEKKADKATQAGLTSVGIVGIQNLSSKLNPLSGDFELIIKNCGVKRVVFVVDSDWDEMSRSEGKPVDTRPKSFRAAIVKFKQHFVNFLNHGLEINVFFGHVRKETTFKGIDDLLAAIPGKEEDVFKDVQNTLGNPSGEGKYLNIYNITTRSDHYISELLHLQNVQAFAKHHLEELNQRTVFQFGQIIYKINDRGEAEMAQPLLPEETFFDFNQKKDGSVAAQFRYVPMAKFLERRGYGRYYVGKDRHIFTKVEDGVLREVGATDIADFVKEFTENLQTGHHDPRMMGEVLEMLYRGSKMYLGPESLKNIKYHQPNFHQNNQNSQWLFFQNEAWNITPDKIEVRPLSAMNGVVWETQVHPHTVSLLPDFNIRIETITPEETEQIKKVTGIDNSAMIGNYKMFPSDSLYAFPFFKFLINCSNFYWSKNDGLTFEEHTDITMNILNKMTAIGYMLHDFRNPSVLKAVVAVDGKNSEVNSSFGRTGKSLMGELFRFASHIVDINGKKEDLTRDKFLFDEVDERTKIIFVDDCRKNLDFEAFFPAITGRGLSVERKGEGKQSLKNVIKFFFTTNHGIDGVGGSFYDRIAFVAFSDYYFRNEDGTSRKPIDDFGKAFFDEWDGIEINQCWNFIAICIQLYLRYGIIEADQARILKRQKRQQAGEAIIDWANTYFSNEVGELGEPIGNRNKKIDKEVMYKDFVEKYRNAAKYIDIRNFKNRIRAYCDFAGYIFNPGRPRHEGTYHHEHGGDIKANGKEYLIVADKDYDKTME
jgi:DNA primase